MLEKILEDDKKTVSFYIPHSYFLFCGIISVPERKAKGGLLHEKHVS